MRGQRSISRSPSRSPRSMSRSRSRSRSWSPRRQQPSHSAFRGEWNSRYAERPGRGGRGGGNNNGGMNGAPMYRDRSRERDPDPGMRGGRGISNMRQRGGGGRFYQQQPEHPRFGFSKGGFDQPPPQRHNAPPGPRRSESRDRAGNSGHEPSTTPVAGSFRDRMMREQREREAAARGNSSSAGGRGRRSVSSARSPNDGEETASSIDSKPHERSTTIVLSSKARRDLILSAHTLPPRPGAYGSNNSSRVSTPKGSQPASDDGESEVHKLDPNALRVAADAKRKRLIETKKSEDMRPVQEKEEPGAVVEEKPVAKPKRETLVAKSIDGEKQDKQTSVQPEAKPASSEMAVDSSAEEARDSDSAMEEGEHIEELGEVSTSEVVEVTKPMTPEEATKADDTKSVTSESGHEEGQIVAVVTSGVEMKAESPPSVPSAADASTLEKREDVIAEATKSTDTEQVVQTADAEMVETSETIEATEDTEATESVRHVATDESKTPVELVVDSAIAVPALTEEEKTEAVSLESSTIGILQANAQPSFEEKRSHNNEDKPTVLSKDSKDVVQPIEDKPAVKPPTESSDAPKDMVATASAVKDEVNATTIDQEKEVKVVSPPKDAQEKAGKSPSPPKDVQEKAVEAVSPPKDAQEMVAKAASPPTYVHEKAAKAVSPPKDAQEMAVKAASPPKDVQEKPPVAERQVRTVSSSREDERAQREPVFHERRTMEKQPEPRFRDDYDEKRMRTASLSHKPVAAPPVQRDHRAEFMTRSSNGEHVRRMSVTDERGFRTGFPEPSPGDVDDSVKPRASSFSVQSTPTGSNSHSRDAHRLFYDSRREGDAKHRTMHSDFRRNSPQRGPGRPSLERHSSFTDRSSEYVQPMLTKSQSVTSASSSYSAGSSSATGFGRRPSGGSGSTLASKHPQSLPIDEARKRQRRDEVKKDMISGVENRIDSPRVVLTVPAANAVQTPPLPSTMSEELPVLPEIPLPPIGGSLDDTGFSTPTKMSKRPRLGWGQGLVASSPPPAAPKRPRIGWGEGLVKQIDSPSSSKVSNENTASPARTEGADIGSPSVRSESAVASAANANADLEMPVVQEIAESADAEVSSSEIVSSEPSVQQESVPAALLEPEIPAPALVQETDTPMVDVKASQPQTEREPVEVANEARPSKEAILASIDELDSGMSDLKKQMKMLQKTLQETEASKADTTITAANGVAADEKRPAEDGNDIIAANQKRALKANALSTPSNGVVGPVAAPVVSPLPVRTAVDPAYVTLVSSMLQDNMRKAAVANDEIPKRLENGREVTKIYRQPSEYAFYYRNIDRGRALADSVRLKVRARNRLRHEHLKSLAREYVDLKKLWKQRVKKMEKDRKRQDKLRSKHKLKQKQKHASSTPGAGDGTSTTTPSSTNHHLQSPHVQVLFANAGKDSSEPSGSGSSSGATSNPVVRTSSRLTNNSNSDIQSKSDLEKLEQAKAQALIDQEVRKKRLKNALTTVIPDMLITPAERKARYFERYGYGQGAMSNGLTLDWKERELDEKHVNPWTDVEKCIYMDKFLQFPKNFARISSFLSNKTTGDVISLYYQTKKVVDYKALLREQQLRRRGAGSKNTWSCWNLSACASIALGVKFPEHVARLLLHPSNFRSHQASDNVLNSAGAQLILGTGAKNADEVAGNSNSQQDGVLRSALTLVTLLPSNGPLASAPTRTNTATTEASDQQDGEEHSPESDTLFSQPLAEFVAGQQQPFLVAYTEWLSDNSYSTGYRPTSVSAKERFERFQFPVDAPAQRLATTANSRQDNDTKTKQNAAAGSNSASAGSKTGGAASGSSTTQLTRKELKQQRKLKRMQDAAAAQASGAGASSSAATSSGANGPNGATAATSRKKSSAASATTPTAATIPAHKNSPRVITSEDKERPSGKKSGKSGPATPGSRRSNQANSSSMTSPRIQASTNTPMALGSPSGPPISVAHAGGSNSNAGGVGVLALAAAAAGAAEASNESTQASGDYDMNASSNATSAAASASTGAGANGSTLPAKRVVQKWTEVEKADFLKFFSVHLLLMDFIVICN